VRPIYRMGTLLTSKHPILYIFSTNIRTEFFKHAAHSVFFSSKCRLFHIATFFGSCIIHILHTGCDKIYMPNSGAKRLKAKIRVQQLTSSEIWTISCVTAIQPGTQHKVGKFSLLGNKKWTKERRSFWKTLWGCVGVRRTMTAVAGRQTADPTSHFWQLVASVLGATLKVSRVEIEQQKMLLITSLETTWVASAHRVL
jgi:hypothetical protein